jgi:hypothetical protein
MNKKLFLISLLAFLMVNSIKAQMIIHGTTSTLFYRWDSNAGTLYKITANEIWVTDPDTLTSPTGITLAVNLALSQVATYAQDPGLGGSNPGDIYVSCYEAKRYNDGDCGPHTAPYGYDRCWNTNNNGCSVKTANGMTLYSTDGNF